MPSILPDNGIVTRLSSQPTITRRALTSAYAFKFVESDKPDYGLLTLFHGNDTNHKNITLWAAKEDGDPSELKVGFYISFNAKDDEAAEIIRQDVASAALAAAHTEPWTPVWYFYEVKGTRTFRITTFFRSKEDSQLHYDGPIRPIFDAQVGVTTTAVGFLENVEVLGAWY